MARITVDDSDAPKNRPTLAPGLAPKHTGSGLGSKALNDELRRISVTSTPRSNSKANTQGSKLAKAAAKKIMDSPTATDEQKRQANDILNPKKPNAFTSVLGGGGSLLAKGGMKLLGAFDTGRAAIVSAASEGNDLLTDVFNLKGHEYVDASWGELAQQTREHVGFGSVFREKAAASAAAGDNSVFGIKVFEDPSVLKNAPKGSKAFKEFLKEGTKATQADVSAGKAKKVGDNLLDYTTGGKMLGIGVGLVGDIGLDPLTYLTMGGSKMAGMSAEAVSKKALEAAAAKTAKKLSAEAEQRIVQKIATKGKWSLNAKELDLIGMAGEGGLHFRVPGTGMLGRNTVGLVAKNKRITAGVAEGVAAGLTEEAALGAAKTAAKQGVRTGAVRGTENLMKYTPVGGYTSARAFTRGILATGEHSAPLGGKYATLKDLIHKGTPKEASDALNTIFGERAASARQEVFRNELTKTFVGLNDRAAQMGIDPTDINDMLADPEGVRLVTSGVPLRPSDEAGLHEATRRIAEHPDGVAFIKDWDEFAHQTLPNSVNSHAGQELIAHGSLRGDWQPGVRAKETYDYLERAFGRKPLDGKYPLGNEPVPANIVPGKRFMGEMLYSVKDSRGKFVDFDNKVIETPMTPREQAMLILQRKEFELGQGPVKAMFETDISKSMPAQINNLSNKVYRSQLELELINRGVASKTTRVAPDLEVLGGIHEGNALTQLEANAYQRRLRASMVDAQLDDANSTIEKLTQRLRILRNVSESRNARRAGQLARMTKEVQPVVQAELAAMAAVVDRIAPLEPAVIAFRSIVAEIMGGFDNAGYLDTPEYAAALERLAASAGAMDKSHAAARAVGRLREDAVYALGQLDAAARSGTPSVAQANARDGLVARIDDLEIAVVGAHGVIVSSLEETHAVLREQLDKMTYLPKQLKDARKLVKDLAKANEVGDHGAASVIESQLRNNFWTDLSRHSDAELKAMEGTTRRMKQPLEDQVKAINAARGEVDGLEAELKNLAKQLEQATADGDPDAIREALDFLQSFPQSEGVALVNPRNEEGLWFLRPVRSSAADGSLGVELHQSPERFLGVGDNTPGVVAKLTNPKVYGRDLKRMDQWEKFETYGTNSPHGERLMRNEMFQQAWENGTLTPQSMPSHKRQWATVQRELRQGSSFEASLLKAFGDLKNNIGLSQRVTAGDSISDGEWLHNTLADRFLGVGGKGSAEMKAKVADDFRLRLARTHDSIILEGLWWDGDPWKVIVLNNDSLETVGGQRLQGLARMQKYEAAAQRQAFKYEEILNKVIADAGINLDVLSANYSDLQRVFIDNTAAREALEPQLRRAAAGTVGDYLDFEYQLRGEVEQLAESASAHRAAAEEHLSSVLYIADEMGKGQAKEAAEIQNILGQLAHQEAAAKSLQADLIEARRAMGRSQSQLDKHLGGLSKVMLKNINDTGNANTKLVDVMTDELRRSMRMLAHDTYAPNSIVHAIVSMQKIVGESHGAGSLADLWDKATGVWKAQAMLRPGFHVRNFLGGFINNTIAHVEVSAYAAFSKPYKVYTEAAETAVHGEAVRAVREAFGDEAANRIDQIVMGNVVSGGQAAAEGKLLRGASGNLQPWSSKFKLYQANGKATANVENHLRGAMAWDRLAKGASMDEVLADVARYHFDYSDLSKMETNVIKRIVPFYTWTRKNLPLQIEMMLENPKVMLRYVNAKKDIEEVTQDDDMRPNWINSTMPIRLPFFQGKSGSASFLSVDAPFKDIGGPLSPGKALESVTPFIKTPVEMMLGRKAFGGIPFKDGYHPVPSVWEGLGIPAVMGTFGRASKDADGNWVMRDKDLYLVEQWLPILGQARKLIPNVRDSVNPRTGVKNVDKYEDRVLFSWASAVFGQPIRTVTATDQNNEMVRRSVALKSLATDLQTKGYMASGTKKQQLQAQRGG